MYESKLPTPSSHNRRTNPKELSADISPILLVLLPLCHQLPSAVLTLLPNVSAGTAADSSAAESAIRFYTTGLLILLPFPDMSMPFNVVAFTSTVLAFFFGSLFNLTYSTTADIVARSRQTPLSRVKNRLTGLLGRCRRPLRVAGEVEGDGVAGDHVLGAKVGEVEKKEVEQVDAGNEMVEETDEAGSDTVTVTSSTTRLRKVPSNT